MNKRLAALLSVLSLASATVAPQAHAQAAGDFSDVEIRVIRQKYFQKRFRLEAGLETATIMNRAFVYTYLGGAKVAFHLAEQFGIWGEGFYGLTRNRGDCETIGSRFDIEPIIDEVVSWAGGGVSYTPIYGKYQLASGDVVYFDWLFSAGAGIANFRKRQSSCRPNPGTKQTSEEVKSGTQFNAGTGQRIFLDQHLSLNWNIRYLGILQPSSPDVPAEVSNRIDSVLVTLGLSFFL